MKTAITFIQLFFLFISLNSTGQTDPSKPCMQLVTERANVFFINDTNRVDMRVQGYRQSQLVRKGDSTVILVSNNRIIPTNRSFELFVYDSKTDSLLFSERFVALERDEMKTYRPSIHTEITTCNYINSVDPEGIVYKNVKNHIILRHTNCDPEKISYEMTGGRIVSTSANGVTVIPGNYRKCEITVLYGGIKFHSKQFGIE